MMLAIKQLLGSKTLFLFAILYSCGITILFLISTSGMPRIGVSHIDKVVHFGIFFMFMFLWLSYLYQRNDGQLSMRSIIIVFLIAAVYGIVIEVFQELFTASRTFDVFDILADIVGSLVGILFFQKSKRFLKLKNSN